MRAVTGVFLVPALIGIALNVPARAADQAEHERYTREAIDRVVESHDTVLLQGGGKLMIKQSAVRSARRLLMEWGREAGLGGEWWDDAPEYRAAKAELLALADATIERRYASGAWLKEAWSEYTSRELNGEEADVIATHFQTEGGQKVRMLMDWYLGEIIRYIDSVSADIERQMRAKKPEMVRQIEAFKARRG